MIKICVVSMIGDHYGDQWKERYPWVVQPSVNTNPYPVTREEFEELKKEVLEMKALLKRAKQYDEDHGEPDCEMDEKVAILKRVAELVGIDLDEVFGENRGDPNNPEYGAW